MTSVKQYILTLMSINLTCLMSSPGCLGKWFFNQMIICLRFWKKPLSWGTGGGDGVFFSFFVFFLFCEEAFVKTIWDGKYSLMRSCRKLNQINMYNNVLDSFVSLEESPSNKVMVCSSHALHIKWCLVQTLGGLLLLRDWKLLVSPQRITEEKKSVIILY